MMAVHPASASAWQLRGAFACLVWALTVAESSFWCSETIPSSLGIILFLFVSSSTTAVSSPAKIE